MHGREKRLASANPISAQFRRFRTVEKTIQKVKAVDEWRVRMPAEFFGTKAYLSFKTPHAAKALKAALADLVSVSLPDKMRPVTPPKPRTWSADDDVDIASFVEILGDEDLLLVESVESAESAPDGPPPLPSPSPPETPTASAAQEDDAKPARRARPRTTKRNILRPMPRPLPTVLFPNLQPEEPSLLCYETLPKASGGWIPTKSKTFVLKTPHSWLKPLAMPAAGVPISSRFGQTIHRFSAPGGWIAA